MNYYAFRSENDLEKHFIKVEETVNCMHLLGNDQLLHNFFNQKIQCDRLSTIDTTLKAFPFVQALFLY